MNEDGWWELDWLQDGRNLLEWAHSIELVHRVILFVRHSHRLHSENQKDLLHMKLTSLGHEMAYQFGKHLPNRGSLEIFHSEHPRCDETAQGILEGYKSNGRPAVILGTIRELLGPFVQTSIGKELADLGIDGFINRWADGEFPENQIETLDDYGKRMWNKTVGQMESSKESVFHVHISHDLVLMSMRRAILRIEATKENWIPFLGGFGIVEISGSFHWFERGDLTTNLGTR